VPSRIIEVSIKSTVRSASLIKQPFSEDKFHVDLHVTHRQSVREMLSSSKDRHISSEFTSCLPDVVILFRGSRVKLKVESVAPVKRQIFSPERTSDKGKCKATPLQAWTGPEGSRSLRLPDFKTALRTGRLYLVLLVLICVRG